MAATACTTTSSPNSEAPCGPRSSLHLKVAERAGQLAAGGGRPRAGVSHQGLARTPGSPMERRTQGPPASEGTLRLLFSARFPQSPGSGESPIPHAERRAGCVASSLSQLSEALTQPPAVTVFGEEVFNEAIWTRAPGWALMRQDCVLRGRGDWHREKMAARTRREAEGQTAFHCPGWPASELRAEGHGALLTAALHAHAHTPSCLPAISHHPLPQAICNRRLMSHSSTQAAHEVSIKGLPPGGPSNPPPQHQPQSRVPMEESVSMATQAQRRKNTCKQHILSCGMKHRAWGGGAGWGR